ncbi:o-succinylbenzoate--CoA ligase [Vibrio parahaemolyticus]|uniref:o-succinylbenzoate--CoA ligase n=1 Tax=Vibrio mediterranei TaxID=689 RepID=UPI004067E770
MTDFRLWEHWATYVPDDIALVTAEQSWTWAQVAHEIDSLQLTLQSSGLTPGQVICLKGRAERKLVFAYLACLSFGLIPAIIAEQPEQQLAIKFDSLYLPDENAWLWDCRDASDHRLDSGPVSLARGRALTLPAPSKVENIASIIFTSGSTGHPKAVVHSAAQHLASARGLLDKFRFLKGDSWLLSLPMYHVSGLAIVWRWLSVGATLTIASGDFASDIAGVSHASLVATQLKRILDNGWPTELKRVLLGGSHIPRALMTRARERNIETWLGYGMTETASTVTAKRVDDILSSGRVLPGRKVKLLGSHILVAGDTLAKGYYRQGELKPIVLTHGWFDTKDLGKWIGDELHVIGRADNLFISGGENVHCEEVEAALNALPNLSQSIVVAVEDEEFGARCVAVVQSDQIPKVAEMNLALTLSLAKFKCPVAYFLMPESLSQSGIKVSRAQIKKWLASHQSNYVVIS